MPRSRVWGIFEVMEYRCVTTVLVPGLMADLKRCKASSQSSVSTYGARIICSKSTGRELILFSRAFSRAGFVKSFRKAARNLR